MTHICIYGLDGLLLKIKFYISLTIYTLEQLISYELNILDFGIIIIYKDKLIYQNNLLLKKLFKSELNDNIHEINVNYLILPTTEQLLLRFINDYWITLDIFHKTEIFNNIKFSEAFYCKLIQIRKVFMSCYDETATIIMNKILNNKELALIALSCQGKSYYCQYIKLFNESILNDGKIFKSIFSDTSNEMLLQYFPEKLKKEYDIVYLAVKANPLNLQYAHISLQSHRILVSTAVLQNGMALEYACYQLQSDEEIVKLAVKQNGMALIFANKIFLDNKEIIFMAILNNAEIIHFLPENIKNDKSIIINMIKINYGIFFFLDECYQIDSDILEEFYKYSEIYKFD